MTRVNEKNKSVSREFESAQLKAMLFNEHLLSTIAFDLNKYEKFERHITDILQRIGSSLDIQYVWLWEFCPETYKNLSIKANHPEIKEWVNAHETPCLKKVVITIQKKGYIVTQNIDKLDKSNNAGCKELKLRSLVAFRLNVTSSTICCICFGQGNEYVWHTERRRFLKTLSNMIGNSWKRDYQYQERIKAENQRTEALEVAENAMHLASIGIVSGAIAHELSQPLSVIKVTAGDLLCNSPKQWALKPDIVQKKIKRIIDSTEKINETIQNIRLLWTEHNTNLTQPVEVNAIVAKAVRKVAGKIKRHSIKLRTNISEQNIHIEGNPPILELIFNNLLVNSIQSLEQSDNKDGIISITTSANKNQSVISIYDNGGGIPENNMHKIFTPFFSTKQSPNNMGLGLAIVKRFVDTYHGDITCKNESRGGVTFTMTFPLCTAEQ